MVKDLLECILITILGQERRTKIHDFSREMEVNTEGFHLDWSHAINLSSTLSLSDYHNNFLAGSKSI